MALHHQKAINQIPLIINISSDVLTSVGVGTLYRSILVKETHTRSNLISTRSLEETIGVEAATIRTLITELNEILHDTRNS